MDRQTQGTAEGMAVVESRVSDQVEILREIAAINAEAIAGIDAHIEAIALIEAMFEERWKQLSDARGDPRLQMRTFGSLLMRFKGELAGIVVARLAHRLRAESSPFRPKVSPQTTLCAVGRHDQLEVEKHCAAFESDNRRLRA